MMRYALSGSPLTEDQLTSMLRETWDRYGTEPSHTIMMSVPTFQALKYEMARWSRRLNRRTRCLSRQKKGHHQARCR